MNCNTHPSGRATLTPWQKASTTEEAIAEATSLITVSCKFLHHSHSRESVSIKEGRASADHLEVEDTRPGKM